MPVMIPPGQGTTVTLPQGGQGMVPMTPGRTAAPPSPFRQTHGPDLLIMPHTQEDQQQSQQPQPQQQPAAQFRRTGKMLQFARRALKLGRPDPNTVKAFAQSAAEDPNDDAPHYVFADYLSDHSDPREEIVRQQLARGRDYNNNFKWPTPAATGYNFSHMVSGSALGGESGYMAFAPHRTLPLVYVSWSPYSGFNHGSAAYRAALPPDKAHEIATYIGYHPSTFVRWPDHTKPQAMTDPRELPDPQTQLQRSRKAGPLLLRARRALKLNRPLDIKTMDAFAEAASKRHDDAPHVVWAGFLEDHGDPRHMIIQEALRAARGRLDTGGHVSDPNLYVNSYRSAREENAFTRAGTQYLPEYRYTADGGWLSSIPSFYGTTPGTQTTMRWIPSIKNWEENLDAPDYTVRVPNEVAAAIHEHVDPFSRPVPWVEHPDFPGRKLGI